MLGHVLIWPGYAVYVGRLLEHEAHAHHAIQISIGLEGSLSLQTAPERSWADYRAVATAPDQLHRIRCPGAIAQIYLDPESERGLALARQMSEAGVQVIDVDDVGSLLAALRRAADGEPDTDQLAAAINDLTHAAAPVPSRESIDPRVQQVLRTMHESPGQHLSLQALADRVALSPSRLGAVFRRDIGIPFRRYVLWLRLIDAIEGLADGMNLTEAAHDAGFSDSAHLSRAFRRMFGMAPSALRPERVEIRRLAEGSLWSLG